VYLSWVWESSNGFLWYTLSSGNSRFICPQEFLSTLSSIVSEEVKVIPHTPLREMTRKSWLRCRKEKNIPDNCHWKVISLNGESRTTCVCVHRSRTRSLFFVHTLFMSLVQLRMMAFYRSAIKLRGINIIILSARRVSSREENLLPIQISTKFNGFSIFKNFVTAPELRNAFQSTKKWFMRGSRCMCACRHRCRNGWH
jgi:hypothetical protein